MSEQMRRLVASWERRGGSLGIDGDVLEVERCELDEQIRQARVVILAAKWAYQTGDPRWLSLWTRAVGLIEACPTETQASLMVALSVLQEE